MIHLIWDMDGTLLDSYPAIIAAIQDTLKEKGLSYENEEIKDSILSSSTKDFFKQVEEKHNLEEDLFTLYSSLNPHEEKIILMPYVKEVLKKLEEMGIANYVFTHRGPSVYPILEKYGIKDCFKEIIDGQKGFSRKPKADAIEYLKDKYGMVQESTYYIGDREIDALCAQNGHIRMIFYQSYEKTVMDSSLYDLKVQDLREIISYFMI